MRRTKPMRRRDDPRAVPGCSDRISVRMTRIPGTDTWDVVVTEGVYTELHRWYRRHQDGQLSSQIQVIKHHDTTIRWNLRRISSGVAGTALMRELLAATHEALATPERAARPDMDPLW